MTAKTRRSPADDVGREQHVFQHRQGRSSWRHTEDPSLKASIKHRMEYALFRTLLAGLNALPEALAYGGVAAIGRLYYTCNKRRQKYARQFLRQAFPDSKTDRELYNLGRQAFGNFMKVAMDLVVAQHRLRHKPMEAYVDGIQEMRECLNNGPMMVVSGHLGSWEAGAMVVAHTVSEAHVITRPLKNPLVRKFIESHRESLGLHVHPRRGGIRAISRALDTGSVGLQAVDQNQRLRGVFAPFFGKLASTERAAATLAVRKGYPIAVCFCLRVGTGFKFRTEVCDVIQPEPTTDGEDSAIAVSRLVRRINTSLEKAILRYPEQYLWTHDRYRTQPDNPQPTPDYDGVAAAVSTY